LRKALAETVVNFLGFSGTASDQANQLSGFCDREWKQALPWLHDAGLSLYLLQNLKDMNRTDVLPTSILLRLEENLATNRRRVAYLARQFDFLNHKLNCAGVRYAVVKGFSLVPAFCQDSSLRHQSDFDYLVDDQSLPLARTVLEDAGYSLQKRKTNELVFLMPSAGMPSSTDGQYEPHSPYAVELRRAFWDSDTHGVSFEEPEFSVDDVRTRRWQGLTFRGLPEEDMFLIQVIHAFNHILTGWVRMSWLYEIAYFLNQRSTDRPLWERVQRRVAAGDELLREMIVVIAELSRHLYRAPIPSMFRTWSDELRPSVGIWIQNYAWTWAFAKNPVDQFSLFSASPVVLFLHQQYLSEGDARRHLLRVRLLPWEQLFRRARSIRANSSANAGSRGRQFERVLIRLTFHLTGGLRYLWEVPRWRKLNKPRAAFGTLNEA
jgi:Uncharacterised nucleotidyltransferase